MQYNLNIKNSTSIIYCCDLQIQIGPSAILQFASMSFNGLISYCVEVCLLLNIKLTRKRIRWLVSHLLFNNPGQTPLTNKQINQTKLLLMRALYLYSTGLSTPFTPIVIKKVFINNTNICTYSFTNLITGQTTIPTTIQRKNFQYGNSFLLRYDFVSKLNNLKSINAELNAVNFNNAIENRKLEFCQDIDDQLILDLPEIVIEITKEKPKPIKNVFVRKLLYFNGYISVRSNNHDFD